MINCWEIAGFLCLQVGLIHSSRGSNTSLSCHCIDCSSVFIWANSLSLLLKMYYIFCWWPTLPIWTWEVLLFVLSCSWNLYLKLKSYKDNKLLLLVADKSIPFKNHSFILKIYRKIVALFVQRFLSSHVQREKRPHILLRIQIFMNDIILEKRWRVKVTILFVFTKGILRLFVHI